jgi:hypothetical protein
VDRRRWRVLMRGGSRVMTEYQFTLEIDAESKNSPRYLRNQMRSRDQTDTYLHVLDM